MLYVTGACEGTLACSTCHLIFKPEIYETLPEPTDEELDMLDLAFGLTDTYVFYSNIVNCKGYKYYCKNVHKCI